MTIRNGVAAAVVAACVACGGGPDKPFVAKGPNHEGQQYCSDLESAARARALAQAQLGWTFGSLSLAAIGSGTVLVAEGDHGDTTRKIINSAMPVVGAILGYAAFAFFTREKDASDLAGSAAAGANLRDEEAARVCNEALARWDAARPGADKALTDSMRSGDAGTPHAQSAPETDAGDAGGKD